MKKYLAELAVSLDATSIQPSTMSSISASVARWLLAFGKLLNQKIRSNVKSTK